MNDIALVDTNAFNGTMEISTKTGTTRRLMLKKEFKLANPDLAGNKLTKAYNLHIKQHGKSMASAAVAYIADSGILLKSVRNTKNTINMSFVKPESLRDKVSKSRKLSPEVVKESVSELGMADRQAIAEEALKGMDAKGIEDLLSQLKDLQEA